MKRASAGILLLWLWAAPTYGQNGGASQGLSVLTPESQGAFERLEAVVGGRDLAGRGRTLEGIAIDSKGASLHWTGPDTSALMMRLERPESGTPAGRYFGLSVVDSGGEALAPESVRTRAIAKALGPLLDSVFAADPWRGVAPPSQRAMPAEVSPARPPWWQIVLALSLALAGLWLVAHRTG